MIRPTTCRLLFAFVVLVPTTSVTRAADPTPASRNFIFTYQAAILDLKRDQLARIWIPVPSTSADQTITEIDRQVPGDVSLGQEPKYFNKILYTAAHADADGRITLSVTYHVIRNELRGEKHSGARDSDAESMYLLADSHVPVGGKALRLLDGKTLPQDQVKLARVLYDVVAQHMVYGKDHPGCGNGDSDWACDSGFGNCTDFHSLFISLARSQQIPAKFEIGFPLPPERGEGTIPGYHCWAKFRPQGHDWIPVDISEASCHPELRDYYFGNLTENRIMLSTGRDLTLTPKQAGEPLNYFIYPYVEVDQKPWPADKIKHTFTYKDNKPQSPPQQSRAD